MAKSNDPKSVLLENPIKPETPKYSDEELTYIGRLLARIVTAKIARDDTKTEFSGQTYLTYFNNNEAVANTTIIANKANKDLPIYSGTVEQKLLTILAEVNRLNLMGEVRVFDKDSEELRDFGMAITDIVHKTQEIEEDQEKKLNRQLELLKQGTVFIQDNWVKKWHTQKTLSKKFTGDPK